MKRILIFLFVFLISKVYASEIDSLETLLNKVSKDKKAEICYELAVAYSSHSIDSAEIYIWQAIEYSKKQERIAELIDYLHFAASLNIRRAKNRQALKIYFEALDYALKSQNDSLLALCYHKVGNGYYFNGILDSANIYYVKALEIREKINDLQGIAAVTNNLGVINKRLKNYQYALAYFKKACKAYKQLADSDGISTSYNNIGVVFWENEDLDSAEFYFLQALEIEKKLGNPLSLATRYNNLGVLARKRDQYNKAIAYFLKALHYDLENESTEDIVNVYNNLGLTYLYKRQYDSSYFYLNKGKNIAKQNELFYKLKENYMNLSVFFKAVKRYDSAYIYVWEYSNLKDSLYRDEIAKQINDLQTKYETEKKDREIEIQTLKLQKSKLRVKLLIFFMSVFIIMSIFLFLLLRDKRKANLILLRQQQEILQQKEEILTQAEQLQKAFENISEQKEQIELKSKIIEDINYQLTSSIRSAKKIQDAMLPFEENFGKYFETFILYLPKDIVAGDFYWFSKIIEKDGVRYIYASVVDCTGHGVPGALMSMVGLRMLGEFINEHKILSPAKVLESMDILIRNALKQDISDDRNGMDICLVRFSFENEKLNVLFAGAKRDLYYFEPGSEAIKIIKGTRRSIGGTYVRNKIPFDEKKLILSGKTIFYLTTDGYSDQNNKERKRMGTQKFISLLNEIKEESFAKQKQFLEIRLKEWMAGTSQRDDITVLGLRVKKI